MVWRFNLQTKKTWYFWRCFTIIKSLLSDRKQGLVLDDQRSNWQGIKAGGPQGSILGSLLFLIYINDLGEGLKTRVKRFADDSSIFPIC